MRMKLVFKAFTLAGMVCLLQDGNGATINKRVTVQPIQMSSTDGAQKANINLDLYAQETDKIWSQAGIDFEFLPIIQYSNTTFLNITTSPFNANSMYALARSPGHGQHTNPYVINLWFVKTINNSGSVYGYSLQTEVDGDGNVVPANGVSVADSAFAYSGNQGMRDIFAYEIGRNLGLANGTLGATSDPNNLMKSSGPYPTSITNIHPNGLGYGHLTQQQIDRARSLFYAVDIEPYQYPPIEVTLTNQPLSVSVAVGQPASFFVGASGEAPIYYQWQFNGADLPGATNATLTLPNAQPSQEGAYSATAFNAYGAVTSQVATLTVMGGGTPTLPTITQPPTNQIVLQGSAVVHHVGAVGTEPLFYQWRKNGEDISLATNALLNLVSVQAADAGNYTVVVTNEAGSVTSQVAVLTVLVQPNITMQPINVTATNGSGTNFIVIAGGTEPLRYQWRMGGTNLPTKTNASLAFAAVTLQDDGFYTVVVTNLAGAVTSSPPARLLVQAAPAITQQPQEVLTKVQGTTAEIGAYAVGTATNHYQWWKSATAARDNPILLTNKFGGSGASNTLTAVLTISGAANQDEGFYWVTVSNAYGTATSSNCQLIVDAPPTVTIPAAQQTLENTPLIFSQGTSNQIRVADQDLDRLTNTLKVVLGKLTLAQTNGLTFLLGDGVNDGTNTFSGMEVDINAALDGLQYLPLAGSTNSDRLTITLTDATGLSRTNTVDIHILAVNDPPVAHDQSVTTSEDTPKAITLTGNDPEANPLTFTVVAQPTNGTLSGTSSNRLYTPNTNYHGADSFTFRVNDGTTNSALATVSITITPVNDAPMASDQSVTTDEDTPKPITLMGEDVDGDGLNYEVVASPTNGTLTGTAPDLVYTPNTNYHGTDSFTFQANDGATNSALATVSIVIAPVNDAPVLGLVEDRTIAEGNELRFIITATDPDGPADVLIFSLGPGAPEGSSINSTNGEFVWTPSEVQVHSSNLVTVVVQDNGQPSLSATQSFAVVVLNSEPVIAAPAISHDGVFSFEFNGQPGQHYAIEAETNAAGTNWSVIATNRLGSNGVWQFSDPTSTNLPTRYYRTKEQ